jgi:hypothetical protein
VEGCAGWRYVAGELAAAGIAAHLAEPANTAFARGRKRHAKTDTTDARHLRMLLAEGRQGVAGLRAAAAVHLSPTGQLQVAGELQRQGAEALAASWRDLLARIGARRPYLPARVLGTRGGGNPAPRPSALAAAVAAGGGLSR